MVIIMAKMRDMDVKAMAVERAIEALQNGTFMENAEPAGAKTFAYRTEFDIEGNGTMTEVWVTIEFTTKMWKAYNTRYGVQDAYDPFEAQAEYEQVLADRETRKAEAEAKKAKKLAKKAKLAEKATETADGEEVEG